MKALPPARAILIFTGLIVSLQPLSSTAAPPDPPAVQTAPKYIAEYRVVGVTQTETTAARHGSAKHEAGSPP